MVEFKEGFQPDARNYWMLNRTLSGADARRYLDSKGVAYKKTSPRSRLDELHARVQRGLPVYDKYTLQELRFRSRDFTPVNGTPSPSISPSARRAAERSQMISYLEAKDEKAVFKKWMNLPSELRVQILKHYFEDLMADLDEHYAGFLTQPPITLPPVSRQLRREALDVFYKCCTMSIYIEQSGCMHSDFITRGSSREFLERAPIECIQALRKLRLRGVLEVPHEIYRWQVDLDTREIKVEWRFMSGCLHEFPDNTDRIAAFEARLREMVAARKDQNGRFILQQGDHIALPAMLDEYWEDE